MSVTLFRSKFLVRIIYKNGVSVDMWFRKFHFDRNVNQEGTKVTWESTGNGSCPIVINCEEVMAIYQMKTCVNVFWYIPQMVIEIIKYFRK
jgi:hypothetical protein